MGILELIDARTDLLEDPTLSDAERDTLLEAVQDQIDQERKKG